ncbi:efflux RND transporter permease subunit [uncultured Desulfobacter sp.]|uniref:efflux RND transporter permease subunit n=1 Tax=uncultured Desulfobacter sp. TaxID=240139 RepID=UPI002AABA72E|nr:efflux RND transporter permease subunit [uncultured Desulfobacter sp.]
MEQLNLTQWSLNHRQLIWFAIFLLAVAGVLAYQDMGRMEDPNFTIREMIIGVGWPGASATEVEQQVTDKIEKELQDIPGLDYLKSYSRPQQAVIYVSIKDSVDTDNIRPTWLEVRNMVNNMVDDLPAGILGPYFNDRFDDVFGNIYALTSDGFTYEQMREKAEDIRQKILRIKSVKKVTLEGVQPEKIYIEMDSKKLARMGIDPLLVAAIIKKQNTVTPSGMLETTTDNIFIRVTGLFDNIDALRSLPIRVLDRTFRLSDIAVIRRAYADPSAPKMYFNGEPAIGIAVSMEDGENILHLGQTLDAAFSKIKKEMPIGFSIHQMANQPRVVEDSINEFIETLAEAIAIILVVSFVSLGLRSGLVVAFCIPLVVAATFLAMKMSGIDLHRVSLGALIISLGLLVDDAMISVEMMSVKLEQGWEKARAACFAYTATAFPMLTGTLITCAGFTPIGFSDGVSSEFCRTLFPVISLSLMISWVVSVMVTPLFGTYLIKARPVKEEEKEHDIYDKAFYRIFRRLLVLCLRFKYVVLILTAATFVFALHGFKYVREEFFPASVRPELVVDFTLPEGASIKATEQQAKEFITAISGNPNIDHYACYVGSGGPRFVLTFDPVMPKSNFAQFIIVAKGLDERKQLQEQIRDLLDNAFPNVRGHIQTLQMGPPEPYPVMLRISGHDYGKVREIADKVEDVMAADPDLKEINFNWYEKTKKLLFSVDQDKARVLGIASSDLALAIQSQLSGIPVSQFRENDKTVDIVLRLSAGDRQSLDDIRTLPIHVGQGKTIPLEQIADIRFGMEEGLIWRRDLVPTITVQAETVNGITGNDASKKVYDALKSVRDSLPPGYTIEIGGLAEQSKKATDYILELVPAMAMIIVIILMIQLQNIANMILTLLTAPLGLMGVIASLLIFDLPMGFLSQLGILALSGIIIRNSVILMDQIDRQVAAGENRYHAIIKATVFRFRPIMLTAAAAILGMMPLAVDKFWGPMAVSIGGGLLGATILTLFVLPCMVAAWYRAKEE